MAFRDIATEREMTPITIESHIVKLYERGSISEEEVFSMANPEHVAQVQRLLKSEFSGRHDTLRPIKDRLEALGYSKISYFEIKLGIVML